MESWVLVTSILMAILVSAGITALIQRRTTSRAVAGTGHPTGGLRALRDHLAAARAPPRSLEGVDFKFVVEQPAGIASPGIEKESS
jgi:hypothetical protein